MQINLSTIRERLKPLLQQLRRFPPLLWLAVAAVTVYAASKRETPAGRVLEAAHGGEFKRERILEAPTSFLLRGKDTLLSRKTEEFSSSQRALADDLERIKKEITGLREAVAAKSTPKDGPEAPAKQEAAEGTKAAATEAAAPATPSEASPTRATDSQPAVSASTRPSRGAWPRASANSFASMGDTGGGFFPRFPSRPDRSGPSVIAFPVKGENGTDRMEVTLPVGSYVKGKLMTGVEAPEGRPYPVLLQLDFAFIGPNKKRIDLAGCFMIAKAEGDLSTERVQMQATKLSCVARDGRMFERDVNGFVADDTDNSFAVTGEVNTKQDRVAAMAFLSSIVEGVSQAVQQAQVTNQTNAVGGKESTITGDQQKYILAGGAGNAAGVVAQWYLRQAQNLLPTINVGSGRDVWIVMHESVGLPNQYFRPVSAAGQGDRNHDDSYSFVSRILD